MLLKDMMTRNVITVSPNSSLREVGQMLKEKKISGIPVIETDGSIVGIVTVTDILKILKEIYQWQEIERKTVGLSVSELLGKESLNKKVKDVMTKNVFTLDENKTVKDLMQLMFTKNAHTIPITRDGRLVGIIGKRDLVYSCFEYF